MGKQHNMSADDFNIKLTRGVLISECLSFCINPLYVCVTVLDTVV